MFISDLNEMLKQQPPFEQKSKPHETLYDAVVDYTALVNKESLEPKFGVEAEVILAKLKDITSKIRDAEQAFLSGNLIQCYQKVSEIVFNTLGASNISHKVDKDVVFYRMRESTASRLYPADEMFHIPFHLRRLVGNQRFSVSGHPSLYLGSSIYVCWEELNRPDFQTANIVALRTKKEMNLLDLRMPKEIKTEDDLYRIPLIVAASVKAKDSIRPFKPEYIISQAILHSLLNQNKTEGGKEKYDGIIYYSTRISDSQKLFDDIKLFENIVIPTSNFPTEVGEANPTEGFCPTLCNCFEVSETISRSINDITSSTYTSAYAPSGDLNAYQYTVMGKMEQKLSLHSGWKTISPSKFFRLNPKLLEKY